MADFFVHIDGKVRFVDCDVELFGFFKEVLFFELLSLFYVKHDDFTFGKVFPGHGKCAFPFCGFGVHLEGIYRESGFEVIFFSEIVLSHVRVVLGYLFVKRPGDFRGLVLKQLYGLVPLSGIDRGFYGFLELSGFYVMVHGTFCLFCRNEVVAPTFFELHDDRGFHFFSQINGLLVSIAFAVAVQRALVIFHLLVELPGPFIHTCLAQRLGDFFKNILRETYIITKHHIRGPCWQATFQIELNGAQEIALVFFDFTRFFLLIGLQEPLEIIGLELHDVRVVLFFSYLYAFVPLVKFLVHLHGLFDFVVIEQDGLGAVKLLFQNREFGLDFEELHAVLFSGFFFVVPDHFVDLSEVGGFGDVPEGGVAVLGDGYVLFFDGYFGENFPVGLCFGVHFQGVEDGGCFFEVRGLYGEAEFDEGLVEAVRDGVVPVVDYYFRLPGSSFDLLDVSFDVVDSHLFRIFNRVQVRIY